VTNDPYFGTSAMASTASSLNDITSQLDSINAVNANCAGTIPAYCSIRSSSDTIVSGVGTVQAQIDRFIGGDLVKDWKDTADLLDLMHIGPYIMVISALFFLCFWYRYGTCCCCKNGSVPGFFAYVLHLLFWLIWYTIVTIVVVIGTLVRDHSDEVKINFLNGSPSVKVFLEHVQNTYPGFWNAVFDKMEEALLQMYGSAVVFWLFCFLIFLYGCCMCCIRPYSVTDDEEKVLDLSVATPAN
jgi:hypothetical protein